MARDRLAALRAQQGGNGYGPVNDYSSPAQSYGQPAYGQQQTAYAPQGGAYEMGQVGGAAYPPQGGDMNSFFGQISDIQESLRILQGNIAQIGQLHSQSLNNMDDVASARVNQQLEQLVSQTSRLTNKIKTEIKGIEKENGSGRWSGGDLNVRRTQVATVKSKFLETIQEYQKVENQSRQKQKQRMERQYRIVKPDATPQEIQQVIDSPEGGQIFSQALLQSNRYGDAQSAYREVQERHEDIKRIERTLTELAQLFNDMSILVEQQDETLVNIQGAAESANKDMEQGLVQTEKAVKSARAARKKRWICFIIILIILAIVAIVVAVIVTRNQGGNKN